MASCLSPLTLTLLTLSVPDYTRICPGRHFANEALYITVASVLHLFNIEPPLDDKGQPMRVEPEIVLDYFLA